MKSGRAGCPQPAGCDAAGLPAEAAAQAGTPRPTHFRGKPKSLRRLHRLRQAVFLVGLLALSHAMAQQVLIDQDTFIPAADTTLEGKEVVVSGATLTVQGPHTLLGLLLTNSAVVTHGAQDTNGLQLAVTKDLVIATNSAISLEAAGTPPTTGRAEAIPRATAAAPGTADAEAIPQAPRTGGVGPTARSSSRWPWAAEGAAAAVPAGAPYG